MLKYILAKINIFLSSLYFVIGKSNEFKLIYDAERRTDSLTDFINRIKTDADSGHRHISGKSYGIIQNIEFEISYMHYDVESFKSIVDQNKSKKVSKIPYYFLKIIPAYIAMIGVLMVIMLISLIIHVSSNNMYDGPIDNILLLMGLLTVMASIPAFEILLIGNRSYQSLRVNIEDTLNKIEVYYNQLQKELNNGFD